MSKIKLLLFVLGCFFSTNLFAPIKFSNQSAALKFDHPNSKLVLDAPLLDVNGKIILKDNVSSTVSGNSITFDAGMLEIAGVSATLTCTFDTTGNDTILLNGDSMLDARYGNVLSPVVVSGVNNTLSGCPVFLQATTLSNPTTQLKLSLKSKLNKNIVLNGGTLILDNDLDFDRGIKLVGDGTVVANGKTLRGLTQTWNGALTFQGGVTIEIDGEKLDLNNKNWTFEGAGLTSCIEGGGNIFELSNTANLVVGPGHTLVLANVFLKGLDDFEGNGFIINPTGEIKISRTSLGLQGLYTLTQGTLTVFGDISKVVSAGLDFTITNSGLLKIDGTTFWYDTLDQVNSSPIKFTNELTQKIYLNGGIIKSSQGEDGLNGVDGALPATDKIINTLFPDLTSNFNLTQSSRIIFENPTAFVRDIELNGNGYVISLPTTSSQYFILEPHVHLTLTNVVLRGFNPATIDWGVGSKITFGQGTVLELPCPINIDRSFSVKGNVCIDGRGARLNLMHDDALLVEAQAKLTIINTTVMGAAGGPHGRLRATGPSATPAIIALQDSGLALDANYTFSAGCLDILSDVKIFGRDRLFTFTSTGTIFIEPQSTLMLDHSITFSYAPQIPPWGLEPYKNSKERLVFADPSATLHLNGCTLHSTHTGLRFKNGRVLIQDDVHFVSVAGIDEGPYGHGAATGEEIEIYDSTLFKILAGSTLLIDGFVRYALD